MDITFNERAGITQRRMEREYNDARREYLLTKGLTTDSRAHERYRIAAQAMIDVGLLDEFEE